MNKDLCNTIKYLFFGGEPPVAEDPALLLEDMKRHCMVPLLGIGQAYMNMGFSKEQKSFIRSQVYNQIKTYSDVLAEQGSLCRLLEGIGVRPVIVKGFSAAVYFPDPALRTTGDVDYLISGALPVEEVADFLSEKGYETDDYRNAASKRHIGINRNGVRFEMHRYFSHGKTPLDKKFDALIGAAGPVEHELQGERFWSMPDCENGLVLLEHMSHHLCGSGLGLRQIIDWMCYVNQILTDELWNASFKNLAEQTGLLSLAVHVTRMCELLFGMPGREFSKTADEAACLALAEDIFKSGNFGRSEDGVVTSMSSFANDGNVFRRLQQGGLSRWEAARKYAILRPFAWLYQLIRIALIMLRPSNRRKIGSGNSLAASRDAIYRSIGIGKYRK